MDISLRIRGYVSFLLCIFVGLAIKANDFVAEFFEFSIGKSF